MGKFTFYSISFTEQKNVFLTEGLVGIFIHSMNIKK